jgi:hypothetical protein
MTSRIEVAIGVALLTACQRHDPDGLTVREATAEAGIRGEGRAGGAWISFESRRAEGHLTAAIRDSHGVALVEYAEFDAEIVPVSLPDGSAIAVSRAPELRILGRPYGTTPDGKADLSKLASSGEGALIRQLGLEIVRLAPGSDLTAERRALELPLQALWRSFPGLHVEAPALNADYEVGPAGFFVLTQPADLVLEVNRLKTSSAIPKVDGRGLIARSSPERQVDDDDMVGGCFGRCGSGCTGGIAGIIDPWPSHWVDTVGAPFEAQQELHCQNGFDVFYDFWATPTTHSVSGTWSSGCQLHDNCCKGGWLTCYTVCDVLIPEAAFLIAVDSERRTWTYTDYDWNIVPFNAGYSGCTCPGSETMFVYDCLE